jgi:hypothetical protein
MAPPANTWKFVQDLWGDRVPKKVVLKATANMEVKVGTLLKMASGRAAVCGTSTAKLVGLSAYATPAVDGSEDLAADDPIEVYLLAPGMVIKGTATGNASGVTGFQQKKNDLTADQLFDVTDTTNGCLTTWKVGDANTEVYCLVTGFDLSHDRGA